ncbi:MAG: DUF5331 domain-containing protein [Nostocales cyanobacterium ELA583]|jgi:hypothetical protein
MAFFDSFTDSLKQKWLQFFQANREWITLQMTVESVYTPDGGKRPSSYLILGVINALEPKLAQLMFPFAKLNPDADTLIEVLDLHFDPDIALGNRLSPTVEPEMYSSQPTMITADISEQETDSFPVAGIGLNDLGDETQATWAMERDDDSFGDLANNSAVSSSLDAGDDFGHVSFSSASATDESNQVFNRLGLVDDNAFGEIPDNAFGEVAENAFTGLNLSEENGFDDVVSDIWGDETSLLNGDENMEELPSEVFNESEMARLFPNN